MSLLRRGCVAALALSLLFGGSVGAATRTERARMAVHWLSHEQNEDGSFPGFSPIGSTADAVVSFVAAKRSPEDIDEAIAYLEANEAEVDSIGEIGKVVMALVAAEEDPHDFAGRDLVAEIESSEQTSGRYGDGTQVFDHALGTLALIGAGETPSAAAMAWLVDAQCPDGGWQFDNPYRRSDNKHCFSGDAETDFTKSDTNTTSLAVQAISQSGFVGYEYRGDPIAFFRKIRDEAKNGWGYSWGAQRLTDANSTSLVIQAFVADGRDLPRGAMKALINLQYRLCDHTAGAFAYSWEPKDGGGYRKMPPDVGATIAAVLGLLKEPLPVDPRAVTEPPPEPEPC